MRTQEEFLAKMLAIAALAPRDVAALICEWDFERRARFYWLARNEGVPVDWIRLVEDSIPLPS